MNVVFLLIAFVCFVLRAFGVGDGGTVDLGWLGAAIFTASALVGYLPAARVTR